MKDSKHMKYYFEIANDPLANIIFEKIKWQKCSKLKKLAMENRYYFSKK